MSDSEIIDSLGGPARLAAVLGYEKDKGTQRVHNWRARGIPAVVKLSRPDLFLRHLQGQARQSVETQHV